jgi:ubiquinol-cytochrome c reductase cytochrome b subunit
MPTWEISFLGHTLSLTVLIPFIVPLGVVLGGAALWPFFERWATGDRSWRNVNDRPRNAPVRTATGIAAMTFYAVLWVEGGNDVIADKLSVPLYTITWTARVLVFAGLAVAFYLTRRICLGLQRKDQELLEHGLETGIIRQLPHGEFVEIHRPLTEEERAVLEAKKVPALMPAPGAEDHNGVPAPSRAAIGRLRARANRAFAETIVAETNGHGNGHRAVEAVAQVTAGSADGGRRGGRLSQPRAACSWAHLGKRAPQLVATATTSAADRSPGSTTPTRHAGRGRRYRTSSVCARR